MRINIIKSDLSLKSLSKPKDKPFSISDGGGLSLKVQPNGSTWWWFNYTMKETGKRNNLSLGVYPETTLSKAREKAVKARENVANGIDPSNQRKQIKTENKQQQERQKFIDAGLPLPDSFEAVAREWLATIAHGVRDITHNKKLKRFETHVFPIIGNTPLTEIKSPDIYALLKPLITLKKLETAHRVHSEISAAYCYAIAHGLTDYDPAQAVAAQIPAQKVKHRAALTEPKQIGHN